MAYRTWPSAAILAIIWSFVPVCAQESHVWTDPSTHKVQFVAVEPDVRLEVLDWGGTGRSLVFLPGIGDTAHVFDDFAPKLTDNYHVYGITRRGFGASSIPAAGYDAFRLGDDVLVVLDSLNLNRPVLVGHSLGGEELSSVGSRRPARVAGLVYVDAGYSYAFDNGKGLSVEAQLEIRKSYVSFQLPEPSKTDRASFAAFRAADARINGVTFPEAELRQTRASNPDGSVGEDRTPARVIQAILAGQKKFTSIPVPLLAIYALPHSPAPWLRTNPDAAVNAAYEANHGKLEILSERQVKAFQDALPSAHVVRVPNAHHYVFLSNEADVLREMRAFLPTLK